MLEKFAIHKESPLAQIFARGGFYIGRGEEIACNLAAACRLSLGRPFFIFSSLKIQQLVVFC